MSIAFGRFLRLTLMPLLVSVSLAACSGPMTPPASIDDDTTVSAITPSDQDVTEVQDVQTQQDAAYASPLEPAQTAADNSDDLGLSDPLQAESQPLPPIDSEPAEALQQSTIPDNGVNIDAGLGVQTATLDSTQPVGLAEEQAADIAEGQTDQPVVDGIGTDTLVERQPRTVRTQNTVDFDQATSIDQITPPSKQVAIDEQTEVAMIPRTESPIEEIEEPAQMSAGDRACREERRGSASSSRNCRRFPTVVHAASPTRSKSAVSMAAFR